jgi:O-antigen biosynthesis protein WbqP
MKRLFDVLVSGAVLPILLPVILIAALAIRLEGGGPALLAQRRIGRGGTVFTCYKMRSMRMGVGDRPTHTTVPSDRTRVGRVLRRYKIDEIPQLWNVLIGDMSLVGPRPCLPSQSAVIEARRRRGVLILLPGLTGLAQVQGLDMSEPERLAQADADYLRRRSLGLDLALILRTVWYMVESLLRLRREEGGA